MQLAGNRPLSGRPSCFRAPRIARPGRRRGKFSKIVLASSPVFPYSTSSHGGVAQLGERLTGSQEVRGSIPLVSTRALNEVPTQVGAFFHIGAQGDGRPEAPGSRQDGLLSTVFKLYKRKKARDDVWPTENSGGPSGIRTQNPGIMSPLR